MPIYHGDKAWAPCAHSAKARAEASKWLADLTRSEYSGADQEAREKKYPRFRRRGMYQRSTDSALDMILTLIGDGEYTGIGDECKWVFSDLHFGFYADMWVGVSATFKLPDGSEHALWTEGDDFTLAMAKTYERLVEIAIAWGLEHPEDSKEAYLASIYAEDREDLEKLEALRDD